MTDSPRTRSRSGSGRGPGRAPRHRPKAVAPVPRLAAALVRAAGRRGAGHGLAAPAPRRQGGRRAAARPIRCGWATSRNLTHATAARRRRAGRLRRGPRTHGTKLQTQIFNAGPAAIEALNAGAIDAAFLGPSPAINAYVKSGGTSLRIIAGAASGGAKFVVDPTITGPADLKGKPCWPPQLGNTQDVALRTWLADQGLEIDPGRQGRRRGRPHRQHRNARPVPAPANSTGPGCPSPGLPPGRGGAARCWWTRRTCGRTANSPSRPGGGPALPRRPPETVADLLAGHRGHRRLARRPRRHGHAAGRGPARRWRPGARHCRSDVLDRALGSLTSTRPTRLPGDRPEGIYDLTLRRDRPDRGGGRSTAPAWAPAAARRDCPDGDTGTNESRQGRAPTRRSDAARSEHLESPSPGAAQPCWTTSARLSRTGEFVCLLGASGCGKSTLLNLVAGLDKPPTGGPRRSGGGAALDVPGARCFPWLTAGRNMELALRLRGVPSAERGRGPRSCSELVHLGGAHGKRLHELSGGMRQRVALARALAPGSQLLLMDEPFAALDAITRDVLHDELTRIWRRDGRTILFVTHNVREAVRLAQRVDPAVLPPGPDRGRVDGARSRAASRMRPWRTCPSRSPKACVGRSAAMASTETHAASPPDTAPASSGASAHWRPGSTSCSPWTRSPRTKVRPPAAPAAGAWWRWSAVWQIVVGDRIKRDDLLPGPGRGVERRSRARLSGNALAEAVGHSLPRAARLPHRARDRTPLGPAARPS